MQQIFEELIESYLASGVGVSERFLSDELTTLLLGNINELYSSNRMNSAGIGNTISANLNKSIRSDKIYWLDKTHNDPHENAFFDVMDSFVSYLNSTCYTGITHYEFHYAWYEVGSFYSKHIDQFSSDDSRQFTMILYLNLHWKIGDGGELCIYHGDHEQNISPNNGKSIFFKSSELAHEVKVTNKSRLSITGWLRR